MGNKISAVILAAGLSSRMGQPKMLLPWGKTTVLGQVLSTFTAARLEEIVVVTGGSRQQIEQLVKEFPQAVPVRTVFNPLYAHGEMLSSIQAGLRSLLPFPPLQDSSTQSKGFGAGREGVAAALIGLGDQPQVLEATVRRICAAFEHTHSSLVIPSFQGRRGHPWLVAPPLWPEILALPASTTPRQFLNAHASQVEYVDADQTILQDLDTPEEYARQRP